MYERDKGKEKKRVRDEYTKELISVSISKGLLH
jgi:hypothetical protein